ncbi:MAG: hypothetical protein LUQ38_04905 [Methanotrichaceae archaeon]|nr:hypothetical protein [Methanotrichaceae archaeon]
MKWAYASSSSIESEHLQALPGREIDIGIGRLRENPAICFAFIVSLSTS